MLFKKHSKWAMQIKGYTMEHLINQHSEETDIPSNHQVLNELKLVQPLYEVKGQTRGKFSGLKLSVKAHNSKI